MICADIAITKGTSFLVCLLDDHPCAVSEFHRPAMVPGPVQGETVGQAEMWPPAAFTACGRYHFGMQPLPELTVYTAAECCLCDDAHAVLDVLAPQLGLTVNYVDITGDSALEATWREQLPAGVLDGRKVFKYHVDAELLTRRAASLRRRQAASSAPV